jgi:hypothetical protein
MVSSPLTPTERSLHERAMQKLRRRLFRRYTPESYFVVPHSEHVIAAYAEECWNAACGTYRVVHLGGLQYHIDCGDPLGHSRFAVSHIEADRFNLWLSAAAGHTVTAVAVRFRDLDEVAFRYVSSHRRANVTPVYIGLKR